MGRKNYLLASALLLISLSTGCSATPVIEKRHLPGNPPAFELSKEIRTQTGWIHGPHGRAVVIPKKQLKEILRNRMRWILYSRALIRAGAWKKKPKLGVKLPVRSLAPAGKSRVIILPKREKKSY